MFKVVSKGLAALGVGQERGAPPPRPRAIADGLLVTATHAESVYLVSTANTDMQSDERVLNTVLSTVKSAGSALEGLDCQVKIIWGRTTGESYVEEMESTGRYTTGDWRRWVRDRGENIDFLDMPERYVLLHVTQRKRSDAVVANAKTSTSDAFGLTTRGLTDKELAHYLSRSRSLGNRLKKASFPVELAPAELIAWEVSRESKREAQVRPPATGTITGAPLAALTRGKVVPFSDHLRAYGADGSVSAYMAVLALVEFPEEMDVPGTDWLRELSEVTYPVDVTIETDDGPEDVSIDRFAVPEASVRFKVLRSAQSRKTMDDARTSAREQRKSAEKHSAGEPDEEILETEAHAREVKRQISREGLKLVEMHPRIIVTGATRAELNDRVDAVTSHFEDMGITAMVGVDDQRDMWLETLPGDQQRVTDLVHVVDAEVLFGSLFWGGSAVGEDEGPCIGWLTGSTPGFPRYDIASSSRRRSSTTTAMIGLAGNGKTVSGALVALEQVFMGGWAMLLDYKGDMSGIVDVAREYNLPNGLMTISHENAGALDMFALDDPETAREAAARQLQLLAPGGSRDVAEVATLAATTWTAENEEVPSTYGAIQWLARHEDERWRELGEHLQRMASLKLAEPVLGKHTGSQVALPTDPGLWVVQLPGLQLPKSNKSPDQWEQNERLSLALMRSVITLALHMTSQQQYRSLPKTLMIPEVHQMLKVADGADFLDGAARMGSANGTHLVLDSQDATGIAGNEGLVEQLSTVFVFQLQSRRQQSAAAELLGMVDDSSTRRIIEDLGAEDRKGHAIMRDYRRRTASIQWEAPTPEVLEMLNTNAYKERPAHEAADDDAADPDRAPEMQEA